MCDEPLTINHGMIHIALRVVFAFATDDADVDLRKVVFFCLRINNTDTRKSQHRDRPLRLFSETNDTVLRCCFLLQL